MQVAKNNSLTQTFLISMILLTTLSIGTVGALWFYSEYSEFKNSAIQIEKDFMAEKKNTLKYEVGRAVEYIAYKRSQTEMRLKQNIRNRTYEAYQIAMNLYQRHRETLGKEEIKVLIQDAIRPIWFNKGRGYYFATDFKGVTHIFADRPELEGTSIIDMQDIDGKYVIQDMIDLAKTEGEGYYRYRWTKPGHEGMVFPKIAFIKHFEPFDWYIGTGEYLDDVEMDIQAEVIDRIEEIRFGRDGYIFAGTYDGVSITGPAKGGNMLNITDPNGVAIVKELIAAAKSGGGFVRYVMPQFEGVVNAPKLSYAENVDAWQWYVGAGLYVGEIEAVIAAKKMEMNERIRRHLIQMLVMLLGIAVLIFFLARMFSGRIKRNLDRFTTSFSEASEGHGKIDVTGLGFAEFESLALSANHMIDARNRAYEEQQETREWLETILNSIQSGIVVIDAGQHRIVDVNPEAVRMLGAPKEDIVGAVCHKYICPAEHGRCPITDLEKKVDHEERELIRADGTSVPVIKTVSRAIMGETDLLVESFIDISEKKQLEARLRESQKLEAVGTLAGGIAHDFNNLMMGVQGRTSLMIEGMDASHAFHEHLSSIEAYVESATKLTGQLLGFARGGKYNVQPTDMNEILRHQSQLFGRTHKEIKMASRFQEDLWPVEVDRGQMVQVLLNLFVNAGQAMPKGGTISFSTGNVVLQENPLDSLGAPPGKYVKIQVTDTGIGMDETVLQRIFEPFYTTKKKSRGTGLGLASAYGIIKNHNGFISAQSTPGNGATFSIWLPASDAAVVADERPSRAVSKGSGTVMLVDDEDIILEVGGAMLERLAYTPIQVCGGKEAIAVFSEQWQTIDIVILDMIMPEMGGGETFDALKRIDPGVKVILSSGYSIDGEANQIMNRGCIGFIQKPFSLQALSDKLKTALAV